MPEGPSLVILREAAQIFRGKRVLAAEGNAKIDKTRLVGQRMLALRTWGKHLLIEFDGFAVRIHLLMFGRYCIDARKEGTPVRLGFRFAPLPKTRAKAKKTKIRTRRGEQVVVSLPAGTELNFYNCAVRYIEGDLDDTYDWRGDVMSDLWDPAIARKKLRAMPEALVCDALLDQDVFAGVGNIIKNEVLWRIRIHPLSKVGDIPARKRAQMVEEARRYSFEFLAWKQALVLREHWKVHNKGICPRCQIKLKRAYLGVRDRRTFFCERCQVHY